MTIRSGHAPVYVRAMLCEAIEYGSQHTGWWEWFATDAVKQFPWAEQETKRWSDLDARGRARWFTTQLWNCADIVPAQYLALLQLGPGLTYAQVVSRLRGILQCGSVRPRPVHTASNYDRHRPAPGLHVPVG